MNRFQFFNVFSDLYFQRLGQTPEISNVTWKWHIQLGTKDSYLQEQVPEHPLDPEIVMTMNLPKLLA